MRRNTFLASALVLVVLVKLSAADRPQASAAAPRVKKRVDPEYSREGREARVQGTALYSLTVAASGQPRDIEIISPLGFGLDEKGIEALHKWVFMPGRRNGQPVDTKAQVKITWRLVGAPYDQRFEERRRAWNLAVHDLRTPQTVQAAVEAVVKLAHEKFPQAVYLLGFWKLRGEHVSSDPEQGFAMIRDAAEKNEPSALFELGMFHFAGDRVPRSNERGFQLLKQASMLGSPSAQYALGEAYQMGKGVEVNEERARYYYRLCAASGAGPCQARLGALLVKAGQDPVQAAAWLELALEHKVEGMEAPVRLARASLTEQQREQALKLSQQLVRHPLWD